MSLFFLLKHNRPTSSPITRPTPGLAQCNIGLPGPSSSITHSPRPTLTTPKPSLFTVPTRPSLITPKPTLFTTDPTRPRLFPFTAPPRPTLPSVTVPTMTSLPSGRIRHRPTLARPRLPVVGLSQTTQSAPKRRQLNIQPTSPEPDGEEYGPQNLFEWKMNRRFPQDSFHFDESNSGINMHNVDLGNYCSESECFRMLFDDQLVHHILSGETNRYCDQVKSKLNLGPSSKVHKWYNTTIGEI